MLGPRSAGVQQLRRLLSSRRNRREEGLFAFEGPELLRSALDANIQIARVFEDVDAPSEVHETCELARTRGVKVNLVDHKAFLGAADAMSPQGCAGIAEQILAEQTSPIGRSFFLVLDEIQDPGNVGALLRVAEGCGVTTVFITGASADPFGPKALRAATGSTFRIVVAERPSVTDLLDELADQGVTTFATSSHNGEDYADLAWPDATALVLGNEGAGLSDEIMSRCARGVRIPLQGALESLNVSVAGGILAMSIARHHETSLSTTLGSTIDSVPTKDPS